MEAEYAKTVVQALRPFLVGNHQALLALGVAIDS